VVYEVVECLDVFGFDGSFIQFTETTVYVDVFGCGHSLNFTILDRRRNGKDTVSVGLNHQGSVG
jgi:hypothetical protein